MTQPLLLDTRLVDVIVLTGVRLVQDSRDTPDIIFPYLEAPLSTLAVGLGNKIAYARFNPNSWNRRRNPVTNETLYNIDLPDYGTSPDLDHAMIGSESHLDTSLKSPMILYPEGAVSQEWTGMVWRNTDVFYQPVGKRVQYTIYTDKPSHTLDIRYNTEMFY